MKIKRLAIGLLCIGIFACAFGVVGVNTFMNKAVSATDDIPVIYKKRATCSPYKEVVNLSDATVTAQILGWQNGKCVEINEVSNHPENKMVCSYSKEQLKELGDALKRDPNSRETTSTGALVIGGTPAEATLTKIWNEAGTCVYPNEK